MSNTPQDLTFEQVSTAFENKEAAEALKEALVLKPIRHEPVKQLRRAPKVKQMALIINYLYPANRSYI